MGEPKGAHLVSILNRRAKVKARAIEHAESKASRQALPLQAHAGAVPKARAKKAAPKKSRAS